MNIFSDIFNYDIKQNPVLNEHNSSQVGVVDRSKIFDSNDNFIFRTPVNAINNSLLWQYPIVNKFDRTYSLEHAQSLLEFTYLVSIHNKQVSVGVLDPISLFPPTFDVIIPLNTRVMLMPENVLWFFYSKSLNIVVLAFTGTYDDILAAVDLDYFQVDPTSLHNHTNDIMMHGGFWMLYRNIQSKLHETLDQYVDKSTQILITGLSLGGATSTIAILDLYGRTLSNGSKLEDIVHYSFASPRVLNIVGAQYYDSMCMPSHRIVNGSDIVPLVPLSIMGLRGTYFQHVKGIHYFDINMMNYYDNHILAYLDEYLIPSVN